MNILFYDCFAGISGDMNLAAMIALGVSPESLRGELSKLGLDDEFDLRVTPDVRKGICGVRVDVALKGDHGPSHDHFPRAGQMGCDSTHDPEHHHGPDHGHAHGHGHGHQHHAPHRNLRDIEAIIMASGLSEEVKRTSLAMFRKVAAAEAKVHGKDLYEVHFHEVGATDSIVDIVGAAICRHRLDVDAVWASPVELGGGVVHCAHGLMPVPAPATVEILQGIPSTRGGVREEATTPTGAAILATLVDKFVASPSLVLDTTAYGIGHRDTERPNILRVQLARTAALHQAGKKFRTARLLQCNIDDMTAEVLGVTMDVLMENGAMDVHFIPILMKKNRPATCLSLLCGLEDEERFKDLLFRHTTTLGIKSFSIEKTELETASECLDTPLGRVAMKNALLDGAVIRSKPELEDCREIARRHDIPLGEVYAHIANCRK